MILKDFLSLTPDQRAEHVFHFGKYLDCCMERGNLYDMGKFYAEVVYNDDENAIQEVRGFQDIAGLEPYLNQIEVNLDK